MDTQFKKGVLELCVLASLARKEQYGYELVSKISKAIAVSEGTIYPLLRRLKDEHHVQTRLVESREGPPRKYYQLTAEGRKRTQSLAKEWQQFTEKINHYLTNENKEDKR